MDGQVLSRSPPFEAVPSPLASDTPLMQALAAGRERGVEEGQQDEHEHSAQHVRDAEDQRMPGPRHLHLADHRLPGLVAGEGRREEEVRVEDACGDPESDEGSPFPPPHVHLAIQAPPDSLVACPNDPRS
jgi:hypothetical protein